MKAAILVMQSFAHFHLIMDSDYTMGNIEEILAHDKWMTRPNAPNFD